MNDKPRYYEGKRREIVRQILSNGCIPMRDLNLMTDNVATFRRQIYKMVDEGVLLKQNKDNLYFVTFKNIKTNFPLLTSGFSCNDPLVKYYELFGANDTHTLTSGDVQRMRRVLLNAEASIFMEASGFTSQIGAKPNLYKSSLPENCKAYFNSREVKGADTYEVTKNADTQQLIGRTRANGMLVTPGGTYSVINTYDLLLQYDAGETRFNNYVEHMVATKGLPEYKGCILLFKDYDTQYRYLTSEKHNWPNHLNNLLYGYKKVYGVNIDHEGKDIMKLLSFLDWEQVVAADFLTGKPRNVNSVVDCDGQDENAYYLVYCKPDLMKLKQFVMAAKSIDERERFVVICFDSQKDFVMRYTEGKCKILTTPLKDYIGGLT